MLFKAAGVPMVENCMGGYNSCVFAYGQVCCSVTWLKISNIFFQQCSQIFMWECKKDLNFVLVLTFRNSMSLFVDWKWKNTHHAWRY